METTKISVVGGAGFVGTFFCRALAERQIDFEIIDLKQSNEFPEKSKLADVRVADELRANLTGHVVVNLAAVHRDDVANKAEYYNTNVTGAENLAVVCQEKGIEHIIFTSSVAVYGFVDSATGEDGKINPFNDYGKSKHMGEQVFRRWNETPGNRLTIVRPTVIFGEGNRGNVYNLFAQIASGKFLMIGSGQNKKSLAYIDNIVEFLIACIRSKHKLGVYNYVDTPNLDMNELVSTVRQTLNNRSGVGLRLPYFIGVLIGRFADVVATYSGRRLPISSIRIKKFCSSSEFLSSASDIDGFERRLPLEQAIQRTLYAEFISPDPDRQVFYTE